MAAVLGSNAKKRGSEKINSTKEKMRATHRIAVPFSLLMKRRRMAPKIGKKIKSDRMGIPRMVMKSTPFFETLKLIFPLPLRKGMKGRGEISEVPFIHPHPHPLPARERVYFGI
jgi:hypothetical protein